jgi:hypothetical protein
LSPIEESKENSDAIYIPAMEGGEKLGGAFIRVGGIEEEE